MHLLAKTPDFSSCVVVVCYIVSDTRLGGEKHCTRGTTKINGSNPGEAVMLAWTCTTETLTNLPSNRSLAKQSTASSTLGGIKSGF